MRLPFVKFCPLVALLALAGCATPYGEGRVALRHERYDEASAHFSESLARDPDRLDARVGFGIARYKLGSLDEAADALRQVVARAPRHAEARFYLGLTYLQKGETSLAEEQLTALLELRPHPRIAAQIDRALKVIQSGPLSDDVKRFVAASLEDEVAWERQVREAERVKRVYVEPGFFIYGPPYWYRYRYLPP